MSENEPIYIYNINNIINSIINNYGFEKPRETILKRWIENIDNPNGLDLVFELEKIDSWLDSNPAKAKKWKKDWRNRIQGWITRTKRFQCSQNARKPPKTEPETIQQVNTAQPAKTMDFLHVCGNFCPDPCILRELSKNLKKPGWIEEEKRRLENVYGK